MHQDLVRHQGARAPVCVTGHASGPASSVALLRETNRYCGDRYVPVDQVTHFTSEQVYCTAHTCAGRYLLRRSLASLEGEFPDLFIRTHNQVLVARRLVVDFVTLSDRRYGVVLDGVAEPLPLARIRRCQVIDDLREWRQVQRPG